jgi:hypothetical protein
MTSFFCHFFQTFFSPLKSPIDTNEYHFLDANYPSPQGREFSWRKSRELARKKAAPSRRTPKRFARNSDLWLLISGRIRVYWRLFWAPD